MTSDFAYIGEELKFAVKLTAQGFSMDDNNFEFVLSCGKTEITVPKGDVLRDIQGNYYLAIDTSVFKKPGDLYATAYAYVPDEDFPDGYRTEIDRQKLILLKKLD